jgi:hypothetical protein
MERFIYGSLQKFSVRFPQGHFFFFTIPLLIYRLSSSTWSSIPRLISFCWLVLRFVVIFFIKYDAPTGSLFSSKIVMSLTCRFLQDYLEDTLHTSNSLPHLLDNIQLLSNMTFQEKPTKNIYNYI